MTCTVEPLKDELEIPWVVARVVVSTQARAQGYYTHQTEPEGNVLLGRVGSSGEAGTEMGLGIADVDRGWHPRYAKYNNGASALLYSLVPSVRLKASSWSFFGVNFALLGMLSDDDETTQSVPLSAVPTLGARTQYPRLSKSTKASKCPHAESLTLHLLGIGVLQARGESAQSGHTRNKRLGILSKRRQVRASGD